MLGNLAFLRKLIPKNSEVLPQHSSDSGEEDWGVDTFWGIPKSQRSPPSRPRVISGMTLPLNFSCYLNFSYSCGEYIQVALMT